MFPILAGTSPFLRLALLRDALSRGVRGDPPLLQRALSAAGVGWLLGVAFTVVATSVRSSAHAAGFGGFVIAVFSYAIVALVVSVPGLAALSLARRSSHRQRRR